MDARPRIICPETLQTKQRLAHLEHARMRDCMLPTTQEPKANASSWWNLHPKDATLTGLLPQKQAFRKDAGKPEETLVLLPDEDSEKAVLHRVKQDLNGKRNESIYTCVEKSMHQRLDDEKAQGVRISAWGVTDYMTELHALAESTGMNLRRCAERFGTVNVISSDDGWMSHPVLGFWKRR